jgi:hypothetical protein
VTPGDLQTGQAYYRITYADPAVTIPTVKARGGENRIVLRFACSAIVS